MGSLSSCSTAPMPFGVATPYGAQVAYGGGGYAPGAPVPAAPAPAAGGNALDGLAQIVTMLSLAVQQLAASIQANAGSAQLGQVPPTGVTGGGASTTSAGCGCGCGSGRKTTPAAPQRRDATDELPPIPTSQPASTPSRESSRRTPPILTPKRSSEPAAPRAPKPSPAPPKTSAPAPAPAPPPAPAPAGSEARILGNGMAFPVKDGKIIQGPNSGGTHGGGPWHDSNALDIEAPEGTPIYAPADGVVSSAKGSNDNPAGRTNGFNMFIDGADNQWFLTHMSKRLVNNGDRITKGQLIGYVGSANNVSHLHIGQKNGNPAETFKL